MTRSARLTKFKFALLTNWEPSKMSRQRCVLFARGAIAKISPEGSQLQRVTSSTLVGGEASVGGVVALVGAGIGGDEAMSNRLL